MRADGPSHPGRWTVATCYGSATVLVCPDGDVVSIGTLGQRDKFQQVADNLNASREAKEREGQGQKP